MKPYRLAVIKDRKGDLKKEWYIEYYYLIPGRTDGKMKRFRVKGGINRHKTKADRKEAARELQAALNEMLRNEFNPFLLPGTTQPSESSSYMKLSEAIRYYYDHHIKHTGERSRQNYHWTMEMFQEKMNLAFYGDPLISQIRKANIRDALDQMQQQRKWESNRTRNNVRQSIYSLFNFLVNDEDIALKENPCRFVAELPEQEAIQNTPPTDEQFEAIIKHLYEHDKHMLLGLLFILYCGLRTTELGKLQVKQLVEYSGLPAIALSGRKVKNKKSRLQMLRWELVRLLKELSIENNPDEWYIFSRQLKPGEERLPSFRNRFGDFWRARVKDELGISVGPYSFKHYQASHLALSGIDTKVIQKYFDHQDEKTTDHYVRGKIPLVPVDLLNYLKPVPIWDSEVKVADSSMPLQPGSASQ